jgi:hypothetical protein
MKSLTERYLEYYTPLIQEFIQKVELLPIPDIQGMPEPFLPLFGKDYENSAQRLIFIGQDTRGWGDLRSYIEAEKANPGINLWGRINGFQDRLFTHWGSTRHTFWGFAMMLMASLHGSKNWGLMKAGAMIEVLNSIAWGNVNAVELFSSTPSKRQVEENFWEAVRGAGKHLDRFEHVWQTLRPRVVIALCRGADLTSYFEGYKVERLLEEGRVTHYHLPDINVHVFHAPHPVNMKFTQGADYFCEKLTQLIRKELVPVFPQFFHGQEDAKEVMEFLYQNGPSQSECDKFNFVAWMATELKKRDSFMSIPALCDLLNRKGYKTDYGSSYEAGRGSYRLVRGAYYRMVKRGEPETAANIALSFKRPNFTYAYSTESDQATGERTEEPTSDRSRFVNEGLEGMTVTPPPERDGNQTGPFANKDSHHRLPPPARRVDLELSHSYTSSEFDRIKQGFVPMDMDEKWFIYYEEPWLYIHRSWTGVCVYGVRFETSADGASIAESWVNRDNDQYTETSIESDRELCMFFIGTLLLGQDLEYPS